MNFNYDIHQISNLASLDSGSQALSITGAGVVLPIGTTAQRINTPALIRFNSDTKTIEGFDGSQWIQLSSVLLESTQLAQTFSIASLRI
jgi:hypothetical protein